MGQLLAPNYDEVKGFGAEILAISHESGADNQVLAARFGVRFPMLTDATRQTIRDYAVVDTVLGIARNSFFLIDRDGIIRWKSTHHSSSDPNDLPKFEVFRDALKKLP